MSVYGISAPKVILRKKRDLVGAPMLHLLSAKAVVTRLFGSRGEVRREALVFSRETALSFRRAAKRKASRRDDSRAILWVTLCFASLLILKPDVRAEQTAIPVPSGRQEVIGRLSGDDVSVNGAISFDTENGRTTALLASGSDLTLRSGQARVDLAEGGDIILCGPAHLSILKSGRAITIALDYGQVHLQIGASAQVAIYTPLLVVTPLAIGDRERDLTVGLDQKGGLCAAALSGALRLEQQFTQQSLIVPQGGEMQIDSDDQRAVRSGSQKCSCELLVSQNSVQKRVEAGLPAHSSPNASAVAPAPAPIDPPAYRIDMPPLIFDASSAMPPPDLTSEAMLVIRESVANPQLSFRGEIRPALPPPAADVSNSSSRPRSSKHGFFARLFGIFHHHKKSGAEQSAAVYP